MNKRMKQVLHSVYYEMKNDDKQAYIEYIKRKIKLAKIKSPLFSQMMELVEKHVKNYLSDFYVHDFNAVTIEQKGSKFIWSIYDCGSRLVRLENDFEEDINSSWEYFEMLAKNYFIHDEKVFIIDVKNQTIKEINTAKIDRTYFSNQFGSRKEYFEKRASDLGNLDYFECWTVFKDLMQEYRDYPPKEKIDLIFKNKKGTVAS